MKVVHVPEEKRFNLVDNQETSWGEMDYSLRKEGEIQIDHTGVSEKRRGEGLGDLLMLAAIEYAKQEGLKINPVCPFAKRFLEKNPEYQYLQV